MDLAIKNGKIVSPTGIVSTAIGINDGKIVAIANEESLPSADKTIDAAGKYILPGVLDIHQHHGFAPLPFAQAARTETQASALGGVTTVGMYLQLPGDQTLANNFQEYKGDWEANSVVDGVFHSMVVNQARLDEMDRDCSEFGVTTFKFLVGYKGPQAAAAGSAGIDDGFVFDGFQRIARLRKAGWQALALVHAENPDLIPFLTEAVRGRYDNRAWHDSRPNFVEAECMNRLIFLASVAECPLYIVHITIGEGVDIIAKARYEGKGVVGETCPQYLTHNHENPTPLMREKPVFTVVNPPIRAKEDNERLWQGIKAGVITVIGSDSAPCSKKEKDVDMWGGGFVPMGVGNNSPLILPVLLSEGVNRRGLPLERVVEVCSYNPAKVCGIYPQKGTISVGSDADIVIVDLDKEVTWRPELSPSIADWSIYDGWKFKGLPVLTILRGKVIMEEGEIVVEPGYGRYIPRKK